MTMIYLDIQNRLIPALGFGTYQLKGHDAEKAIITAIDTGYRHIDTAQIYGNEQEVGNALIASGVDRKEVFLTTKVWIDKTQNGALQSSVEESLNKLQTPYVDLLLLHWPVKDVPLEEQIDALKTVKEAGHAKMIGVSNYTLPMMKEVVEKFQAPIATNQVEYHPYLRQKPMVDYLTAHKMFLTAYSPLAQGKVRDDAKLAEIGEKYSKTPGQVALRWLVQQRGVAAIPKASSPENIKMNFDIFNFELTAEDMNQIGLLARPDGRIVKPAFGPVWDEDALKPAA